MNKYVVGQQVTLAGIFKDENKSPVWPVAATFKVIDWQGNETTIPGVKDETVTGRFFCKHTVAKPEAGGITVYRGESETGLIAAGQKKYSVEGDPFT